MSNPISKDNQKLNIEPTVLSFYESGQFRSYNVEIARKIGIEEAIILNDLIERYRDCKGKNELVELDNREGFWFHYTNARFLERTTITKRPLTRILKNLREKNLIITVKKGRPPINYFQFANLEILMTNSVLGNLDFSEIERGV